MTAASVAEKAIFGDPPAIGFKPERQGVLNAFLMMANSTWVNLEEFLADAGGATPNADALEAAFAALGVGTPLAVSGTDGLKGGVVYVPAGNRNLERQVNKPDRIYITSDGSRQAVFKATGLTAAYPDAMITSFAVNDDDDPTILFSTGITNIQLDANGVANVCLGVRGDQENCAYDNLALVNFLKSGLKTFPLVDTTHGAYFGRLHVVPYATGTDATVVWDGVDPSILDFDASDGAIAIDLHDCHFCNFVGPITTDKANAPDGDGQYLIGICVRPNSILNKFGPLHTEDAAIGIYNGDAANTFIDLSGYNNYEGAHAHFHNTSAAASYVILNILTFFDATEVAYHIYDPLGGHVPQASYDRTAIRVMQATGSNVTVIDSNVGCQFGTPTRVINTSQQLRGPGGGSGYWIGADHVGISGGATVHLNVEAIGTSGGQIFTGTLHLNAPGINIQTRTSIDFMISINDGGSVGAINTLGTPAGLNPTLFTVTLGAHGTPDDGKFRFTIVNTDPDDAAPLNARVDLSCYDSATTDLNVEFVP